MSTSGSTEDFTPARLDTVDLTLLRCVQESGRMTLVDLARKVGMSSPSTAERLRRLEESGVIARYAAIVEPEKLGYTLQAFIRLAPTDPRTASDAMHVIFDRPEVREAHHVVGNDCWVFKVAVRDTRHLEQLLLVMATIGTTTTSIVLSSPVHDRPLAPSTEAVERSSTRA
jgi:Lrp/AsnC family leucine-responsive transcriptional regulator